MFDTDASYHVQQASVYEYCFELFMKFMWRSDPYVDCIYMHTLDISFLNAMHVSLIYMATFLIYYLD